jgi:AbrB family looped-hinge helix DNA binding protein
MSNHTRVSAKGQVVIPKDVRDRLKWEPGTELEVMEGVGGVILRPRVNAIKHSVDEMLARMAERSAPYRPAKPLPIEEISGVSTEVLREYYAKERPDAASRD